MDESSNVTRHMSLRSARDSELAEELLQDSDVISAINRLEQETENSPQRIRRKLLATSVRLTPRVAPVVHTVLQHCVERLEVDIEIEAFVYSSPVFNAACVKPERGRLFLLFSSSLLDGFGDNELRYVAGHELGHHLFNHHDIPVGWIANLVAQHRPGLALKLFTWSRFAEISADRAGAACTEDLSSVGRALFKLASGMTGPLLSFNLEDFLSQIDDMRLEDDQSAESGTQKDWFATHPFSPLRVKAVYHFFQSALMTPGGVPREQLELKVQQLMNFMEPGYLEARTTEAEVMRRLLFAGAIAVADASDGISKEEISVFEEFFGPGSFSEKIDVERSKAELSRRIADAVERVSIPRRMQVVRDIALIAKAGGFRPEERAVLHEICIALGIGEDFVDSINDKIPELD
jgi:hypothetical protein